MDPLVPVSVGELVDKYTILQIKFENIVDPEKRIQISKELNHLQKYIDSIDIQLIKELKEVNQILWNIEDLIRIKESLGEFDDSFISLARSVYKTNDLRFALKSNINKLFKSGITEVKSYSTEN
uniref:Uncharacterized protein n=1 Tax=viral metagenome TaxID=1070528 RepID=A0A6C0I8I9_9ZZZZ